MLESVLKNKIMRILTFFTLLALTYQACQPASSSDQAESKTVTIIKKDSTIEEEPITYGSKAAAVFKLPYELENADLELKLSNKLAEISGLSLSADEKYLLAVNDEQGKVFFLDKTTGEILEDEKFAKSGDYEGIEQVNDIIYVVNSSGSIFKVQHLGKDNEAVDKFNTPLNSDNDVEGLGYWPAQNALLLACKNKPGKKSEYAGKRAIYTFDLAQEELSDQPIFLIDLEAIKAGTKKQNWLLEELQSTFAPSAIAVHPKSGDLYVLSSVGKLLIVLNDKGKIKHIEQLKKSEYKQPEGLCFAQDGTMFMSSEGKGGRGRIYRFDVK